MKIEVFEKDKTVSVNLGTNYIFRLNQLLLSSGWFKDEQHMAEVCAAINRGKKEELDVNPVYNTDTVVTLIVLITEAAREAGLITLVEVDESGNPVKVDKPQSQDRPAQ
jgi:hypothetical protein